MGVVRRLCCGGGESEGSDESGVQRGDGGGVSASRDTEMRVRGYVTLVLFGGYLYTSYIVVYGNFYGCMRLTSLPLFSLTCTFLFFFIFSPPAAAVEIIIIEKGHIINSYQKGLKNGWINYVNVLLNVCC